MNNGEEFRSKSAEDGKKQRKIPRTTSSSSFNSLPLSDRISMLRTLVKSGTAGNTDHTELTMANSLCDAYLLTDGRVDPSGGRGKGTLVLAEASVLEDAVDALHVCSNASTALILTRCMQATFEEASSLCSAAICAKIVNAAMRCICALLAASRDEQSTLRWLAAVTSTCDCLVTFAHTEKKFLLKARITGLLVRLTNALSRDWIYSAPNSALRVCYFAVRSGRNAVAASKNKAFVDKIVTSLREVDDSLRLLTLAEIVFYLSRCPKNRTRLLDADAMTCLVGQMKRYTDNFSPAESDDTDIRACLAVVGAIRQLAKTRKGRDTFISMDGRRLCRVQLESGFGALVSARRSFASSQQVIKRHQRRTSGGTNADVTRPSGAVGKLVNTLCELAMRCLLPQPYPLAGCQFPLSFTMPQSGSKNASNNVHDANLLGTDYRDSDDEDDVADDLSRLDDALPVDSDEDESQSANAMDRPQMDLNRSSNQLDGYAQYYCESTDGAAKMPVMGRGGKVVLDGELGKKPSGTPGGEARRYIRAAKLTRTVVPLVKLSYPDMTGAYPNLPAQPLKIFTGAMRETVLSELEREERAGAESERKPFDRRTVFDLDQLISDASTSKKNSPHDEQLAVPGARRHQARHHGSNHNAGHLGNDDMQRLGVPLDKSHLSFESRFESGNLRRADQVGERDYELFMSPDVNAPRDHYQWFYFELANMRAGVPYTFNIVNGVKNKSMFGAGMQPVLFSVREAADGRPGWVRAGHSVCYYRNRYSAPPGGRGASANSVAPCAKGKGAKRNNTGGSKGSSNVSRASSRDESGQIRAYYTLRFCVCFRHDYDVCYVAYHYPYTYSYLMSQLSVWNWVRSDDIYHRMDSLATSLGGNQIPLLTITAKGDPGVIRKKVHVVFSCRVHPGEANSSWMMHGCISYLLSSAAAAKQLRKRFVFKIVPMLNPDGVANGSHRCSLAGDDLNRQWAQPQPQRHPEIEHVKNALLYLALEMERPPMVYVDFHGHSRRCNVFFYGNNPAESWWPPDNALQHKDEHLDFPTLVEPIAPAFALDLCSFKVQRSKEPSARVVAWRQLGLKRAYTMEATYCGFDRGPYAGSQVGRGGGCFWFCGFFERWCEGESKSFVKLMASLLELISM